MKRLPIPALNSNWALDFSTTEHAFLWLGKEKGSVAPQEDVRRVQDVYEWWGVWQEL